MESSREGSGRVGSGTGVHGFETFDFFSEWEDFVLDGVEGTFSLGLFAEDETDEDVETSDGEEEEGCNESEEVYMVRENSCSDPIKKVSYIILMGGIDATHKHWKTPRAPTPKFDPRTGKNLSKKDKGNPISERKRKMHSPRMRRRLTTAQNTPAG